MLLIAKLLILLTVIPASLSANWAVLIAGSNYWYNYRHQADVYHAYQTLVSQGISKNNIITFAFDDIANYTRNPFPGKVFNKPTYASPGNDVYQGVQIDYRGADVSPDNFIAAITGNK